MDDLLLSLVSVVDVCTMMTSRQCRACFPQSQLDSDQLCCTENSGFRFRPRVY